MNKIEAVLTKEKLQKEGLSDEYIYRELAFKLIKEMDFNDLSKMFNFKKSDFETRCGYDYIIFKAETK